jgi:nucleotide-binding universal stress UspA family protein
MNSRDRLPVVVAVDGSAASEAAVAWAAADAVKRGLTIVVVHVDPPSLADALSTESRAAARAAQRAREMFDAARAIVDAVAHEDVPGVDCEMLTGHRVAALAERSKTADTLVIGFRGRGALGADLLGPVSDGVVRHASCPVVVVHEQESRSPVPADAPVVVGVDGSPASARAVGLAFEQACLRGVDLVAVHASSDQRLSDGAGTDQPEHHAAGREFLRAVLAPWGERYPNVQVRPIVVLERPAAELISRSATAQLVVVGSRGRGGFAGMMLGSVSSAVVRSVEIPVMVVRVS